MLVETCERIVDENQIVDGYPSNSPSGLQFALTIVNNGHTNTKSPSNNASSKIFTSNQLLSYGTDTTQSDFRIAIFEFTLRRCDARIFPMANSFVCAQAPACAHTICNLPRNRDTNSCLILKYVQELQCHNVFKSIKSHCRFKPSACIEQEIFMDTYPNSEE